MGDLNGFDLKKILKETASEKIYDEFNNTVTSDDYKKHCKAIFNSPKENTKLKDLCYKYERNIKELSNEQDKVRARDRCYHSMCWIFDEIRKFIRSNSYNFNHLDVLKKFHDVEKRIINDINSTSDANDKYLCRSHFTYHDLEERKNVKYMHDYIKNYVQIKQNIISGKNNCGIYRKYVEFIKILYKKHKEECCKHWNTECHKYFSCDPFYDPDNLFPALEICENGKSKSSRRMDVASVGKISKNSSEDSEKEFNMKIKNVRCVAYKYEDYGFLSCFDSPITHNVTIKGNEKLTSKPINDTNIASRSRGLEFLTRSTLGIPRKVYKVEKEGDMKKKESDTFNIIKGMKNSRCKIIREDETKGIVELNCFENSSTPNSLVGAGQGEIGHSTHRNLLTNGVTSEIDETIVWKKLKQSKAEACSTDLLGFCVDPQNAHKNKAREENIEYKSSYMENEIQYNSDTSYFTNSEMENSVLSSLYTKIGLVSALVLGSFLVFLMYYKYTPLGLWMGRKKVNKRANAYNHHEDYRSQISKHEAKDININMPKKRVRIAYNPV
ncbi:PIR protein [Plasmodium vivax]|uniref:Variable surface protein Vir22-like protein n=1 Tax=Plasmodium vivax Mauritania I TaxID=1035515 RepID=A0A0J9TJJ3_PLAVI|nr:variable surface protein Vir22-like protein [Plasmodium vivax Mauritania I]CAI7718062.1 PIR protein [Plasmodium vivax]